MKTPHDLLTVLSHHIGHANGITVHTLSDRLGTCEREVRRLVSELRLSGHAVCGHPRDGYYIAETPEELDETCKFLRNRAIHSLQLESRLRNIPMPDLLGQIHLNT